MTVACGVFAAAAVSTIAQEAAAKTSVWEGVYTDAQAERGSPRLKAECATCHGDDMRGAPGSPGIAGAEFMFGWDKKTLGSLYDYIKAQMPLTAPGSLTDQQYADILAALLKANGFPASPTTELEPKKELLDPVVITRSKPN
jgi:mono/diheme cytochrome c family protein